MQSERLQLINESFDDLASEMQAAIEADNLEMVQYVFIRAFRVIARVEELYHQNLRNKGVIAAKQRSYCKRS